MSRSIWSVILCGLVLAAGACGGSQPAPAAPAPAPSESAPAAAPAAGAEAATPAAPVAPAAPAKPGPNQTPDGVVFNFKPDSKPKKIFLAGNFNEWNPANEKYLLKDDDGDGMYSITVKLPAGTYQYKFVADGNWIKDPASPSDAPDGFGGRNGKFDVK